MDIGDTKQVGAITYIPADTTDAKTVTWTSADDKIATVSVMGLITAIKDGTVDITVTSTVNPAATDTISVTVNPASPVTKPITKIELATADKTIGLKFAETKTLATPTITPADTTDAKTFDYSTSDKDVADVSSAGVITAGHKSGSATITVASKARPTVKDTSAVTVETPIAAIPDVTVISPTELEVHNDGITGIVDYIVRWGLKDDGVQDSAVVLTGADGNVTITQAMSNVTLAGNEVEVWAYALEHTYANATAAIQSAEYDEHKWSAQKVVTVPALPSGGATPVPTSGYLITGWSIPNKRLTFKPVAGADMYLFELHNESFSSQPKVYDLIPYTGTIEATKPTVIFDNPTFVTGNTLSVRMSAIDSKGQALTLDEAKALTGLTWSEPRQSNA